MQWIATASACTANITPRSIALSLKTTPTAVCVSVERTMKAPNHRTHPCIAFTLKSAVSVKALSDEAIPVSRVKAVKAARTLQATCVSPHSLDSLPTSLSIYLLISSACHLA